MEDLHALINNFNPVFLRACGMMAVLPFGGDSFAQILRVSLAAGIALIYGPYVTSYEGAGVVALIAEFILGVIIALPTAITVSLAEMMGELLDNGRGQSLARLYDPNSGQDSHSVLSVLGKWWVWGVILSLGALEANLVALISSFNFIPSRGFNINNFSEIGLNLLTIVSTMLVNFLLAFMPFAILFLVIDLAFGFFSRLVSNLSTSGESFMVKTIATSIIILALQSFDLMPAMYQMSLPSLGIIANPSAGVNNG